MHLVKKLSNTSTQSRSCQTQALSQEAVKHKQLVKKLSNTSTQSRSCQTQALSQEAVKYKHLVKKLSNTSTQSRSCQTQALSQEAVKHKHVVKKLSNTSTQPRSCQTQALSHEAVKHKHLVKKLSNTCNQTRSCLRRLKKILLVRCGSGISRRIRITSVAGPGCLSRIRIFSTPDPGSTSKNLSTLTPKNGFFSHPGFRILRNECIILGINKEQCGTVPTKPLKNSSFRFNKKLNNKTETYLVSSCSSSFPVSTLKKFTLPEWLPLIKCCHKNQKSIYWF